MDSAEDKENELKMTREVVSSRSNAPTHRAGQCHRAAVQGSPEACPPEGAIQWRSLFFDGPSGREERKEVSNQTMLGGGKGWRQTSGSSETLWRKE